ncbi:Pvc16 family protein [Nannocystis pusilla]|uniref:Pvc16 family protein n=1 Tax=Nannocystis pusilla TaxID=889268 RepID=UPI003B81E74D
MALEDLSFVTETLITLLTNRIGSATVVAQAPDQLPTTTTNTISVYLYHAREDAHYKNAVARDGTSNPFHTRWRSACSTSSPLTSTTTTSRSRSSSRG